MQPFSYYSNSYSGGQIVRTLLSLALVYPKWTITIYNIRAKKPNPGLHRQLVDTFNMLIEYRYLECSPEPTVGLSFISLTGLKDKPLILPKTIITDGSIWLVTQALLPVILFRGGDVTVQGVYYGANSIINCEQIKKILHVACLDNLIDFTYYRNGVNGVVNIKSAGISKQFLNIGMKRQVWLPYIKDREIITKLFFVDNINYPKTCLIKNSDNAGSIPPLFEWQLRVLETNGFDYSVFDNLFELAIIFGGSIDYPAILEEVDMNGKPFDSHMTSLLDLANKLSDIGYCRVHKTELSVTVDILQSYKNHI